MAKKVVNLILVCVFVFEIVSVSFAKENYVVVPAQKTFVSAESRLKDLAKKAEEQRMNSGMHSAGFGLLYIGLGAAYGKTSYGSDYSSLYYLLGGGMLLVGIRSLMFPTELENNYINVRKMPAASIEDRSAREAAAENALKKGAEEAAQGRRIAASVLGGGGLIFMGSSPLAGTLLLGTAALSYFMKSDVEKAYDEYVADKENFMMSQPASQIIVPSTVETETSETTPEVK